MQAKKLTEKEFLSQVLEYAKLMGWLRLHIRPGRTKGGWRTPVQGDGVGFPDCLFLRRNRLVVAELKMPKGILTDAQEEWLRRFDDVGAETYVWWPSSWPEVERVLA